MSVWTERDLVVLKHLHDHPPPNDMFETNWHRKDLHPDFAPLRQVDVHVAVETLLDEGLLTSRNDSWNTAGGVHWIGLRPSGAGLQTLGEWPAFEVLGSPEALGQLLDELAATAPSDEEEANLRTAAAATRARGRELFQSLAVGALRAVVRSQL